MSSAVGIAFRSCGLAALALSLAAQVLSAQWRAELIAEGRLFRDALPGTPRAPYEIALVVDAAVHYSWDRGRQSLSIEPYVRWNPDGRRDRIDFRELGWQYLWDRWELRVGVWEVFWGVSESRHLVDVINQRDLVVSDRGYVKMGQPMVGLTRLWSWGTTDFFLLPRFRERPFDGRAGLLWSRLPVDASRPVYDSGAKQRHLDWAVRWSHTVGEWDVAISHFAGTRREPRFLPEEDESGRTVLIPRYDVVVQTSLETQWTRGGWMWKLEALTVNPKTGRYVAAVGGLEYAFADYFSVFGEYLYDSRGGAATSSFGDDFFAGARLLLQDGQVRGGAFVDRRTLNSVLSLSVVRRLGDAVTVELEARTYLGDESLEPRQAQRQHRYLSFELTRYF
jgi:hypothetical protein